VNTGILEREAGRLPEAVRLLRDGLRDAPDDALAWRHLGLALDALGDRRAALDAYLAGLARRPDDLALRTAAFAFFRKAALDQALLERFLVAPPGAERDAVRRDIAARLP
jgi:tetratricopeptide (TPR) repeat protein